MHIAAFILRQQPVKNILSDTLSAHQASMTSASHGSYYRSSLSDQALAAAASTFFLSEMVGPSEPFTM